MHSTKEPVYPDPRLWTCIYELILKAHWENSLPTVVAKMLGRKVGSCSQRAKHIGLKVNARRTFSGDVIKYIETNYKRMGNSEIADNLNRLHPRSDGKKWKAHGHVRGKMTQLGLDRTQKQLDAINKRNHKKGRFDGIKGENHIRYKPVGTIAVIHNKTNDAAGNKLDAYFIKTEKGWVLYKKYLWENANGKLPKGHRIWFKDGDVHNVTLENLYTYPTTEPMYTEARNLTDNYIAKRILSSGDHAFAKFLLEKGKPVIDERRTIMEAKRELNAKNKKLARSHRKNEE